MAFLSLLEKASRSLSSINGLLSKDSYQNQTSEISGTIDMYRKCSSPNYVSCFVAILPSSFLSVSYPPRRTFAQQKSFRTPRAKLRVDVLTLGKPNGKDAAYDVPIQEYVKRMSGSLTIHERYIKNKTAVETVSEFSRNGSVILLDEKGVLPSDSVHFSKIVFNALERGGSRLAVVIGDADGLPAEMKALSKNDRVQLISLSSLTFTHKMVKIHPSFLCTH